MPSADQKWTLLSCMRYRLHAISRLQHEQKCTAQIDCTDAVNGDARMRLSSVDIFEKLTVLMLFSDFACAEVRMSAKLPSGFSAMLL